MSTPLLVLSIFFVGTYVLENFHSSMTEGHKSLISALNVTIWVIFAADYLLMLISSPSKMNYFKTHLLDLLLVLLPFFRVLRVIRVGVMFFRKIELFKNHVFISIPLYTLFSTLLFTLLAAASVFNAEYQNPNANIKTPEDSLWWAVVTVFTVGYGDKFPVTAEGRWFAVGLMICGIAVVGSVTATFASWLIGQVREVESDQQEILKKLAAIESKLEK
jgi:voltage-gated potassium channel